MVATTTISDDRNALSGMLRLLPPQKFLEQWIGICRGNRATLGAALRRNELPEIRLRGRRIRVPVRREPLLRCLETLPAFHGDRKIDLAPFWMIRRLSEFLDLWKERLDKPLNAAVAVGIFRPVEPDQNDLVGNGLDDLSGRNQVRIVIVSEIGRQVLRRRDFLRERDRDEVYSAHELQIRDQLGGFAGDVSRRRNLTGLEHFKSPTLDYVDFFDLDPEALEDVAHRLARTAPSLVNVHLAAVELFDRRNVTTGDQMHFFVEQLGDVDDFVVVFAERLVGAAKAIKNAQLGEADVHSSQVAYVANVLRPADADDWKNPEFVGVVEYRCQIIRDLQIRIVRARTAGNDRDGVFVDLLVSVDADAHAIVAYSIDIARFIVDLLGDGTEPSEIDPAALSAFADGHLLPHKIFAVLVAEIPQIGAGRHRGNYAVGHYNAILVDNVGVKIAIDCSRRLAFDCLKCAFGTKLLEHLLHATHHRDSFFSRAEFGSRTGGIRHEEKNEESGCNESSGGGRRGDPG